MKLHTEFSDHIWLFWPPTLSAVFWLALLSIIADPLQTLPADEPENGPVLLIPNEPGGNVASQTPTSDAFLPATVQPRVGQQELRSSPTPPAASDDGWTKKGQSPPAMAIPRPGPAVSVAPASPGVMPAPIVVSPAPATTSASTPQASVPYPYGTPAPVPALEPPKKTFLGLNLPKIFPQSGDRRRSSLGEWWDSLWTKNRGTSSSAGMTQPQSSYAVTGPPIMAGSGPVWSQSWPATPGGAGLGNHPVSAPAGGYAQSGSHVPAVSYPGYAVPYATPSHGTSSTSLSTLPLTAGTGSAGSAGQRPASPGTTSAINPQSVASPPGQASSVLGDFTSGWSAPGASAASTSASSSATVGTPYTPYSASLPGPSSGAVLYGGNSPGGVSSLPTGYGMAPLPETPKPSLWDRVRRWWADATAPVGGQARQQLLPRTSQTGQGLLRPAQSRPTPDPFSTRVGTIPASPQIGGQAIYPGGSPAVLPPPSSQLPLRQAW